MMRETYARLPYPSSVELEWLFKIGVPADAMAEPMFQKITLVGIGLIGSSLAHVIRRKGLAGQVAIATRSAGKAEGEKS